MIGKYQTRPHPNGDCMRACLASLLELPILSVPDFTLIPDKPDAKEDEYPEWYMALQTWVRQFGFAFVEVQLDKKTWMPLPCEMLAIFMGPHESGCKHAIVGRCVDHQFYPLFDPLGEETAPFTTVEAVCLLVPVDPMIVLRMGVALEEIRESARGITSFILKESILDAVDRGLKNRKYQPDQKLILGPNGEKAP